MGLTTALIATGVTAAAVGAGAGVYSAVSAADAADEANDLQSASMKAQADELGRTDAKAEAVERNAKASTAATQKTPDLEGALNLDRKKRGVQSSFTATTGAGAGNMKGTTLSPLGSDSTEGA